MSQTLFQKAYSFHSQAMVYIWKNYFMGKFMQLKWISCSQGEEGFGLLEDLLQKKGGGDSWILTLFQLHWSKQPSLTPAGKSYSLFNIRSNIPIVWYFSIAHIWGEAFSILILGIFKLALYPRSLRAPGSIPLTNGHRNIPWPASLLVWSFLLLS